MKILVVEDNVKLNDGIKIYLEENGFEVDTAFNGVQALSKVKDLQKDNLEYDVIILDRMMPLKDGIETLREIKNLGIESGIIILTAKDTVEDKVFGLAAGADDYMVKPFNVKELIARIHSLYRRDMQKRDISKMSRNMMQNNIINNTDKDNSIKDNYNFNFDLNSGEIIVEKNGENKNIISLTNKEANIFKILLDANANPVSKEDILKIIWRESDTPSSRFVDVHVHNLRNKLLENNFSGRIETVRNLGYKLLFN